MDVRRITLTLHPAIITVAYIASFLSSRMHVLFVQELGALWWLWSLYSKALPPHDLWRSAAFASSASAFGIALASHLFPSATQPAMLVGIITFMLANWLASDALVRFETGREYWPWRKTLVTFLQVFYLPIGIWFLKRRLTKLLA